VRDYSGHFGPAYTLLLGVLILMLCITPLLKPAVEHTPQVAAA